MRSSVFISVTWREETLAGRKNERSQIMQVLVEHQRAFLEALLALTCLAINVAGLVRNVRFNNQYEAFIGELQQKMTEQGLSPEQQHPIVELGQKNIRRNKVRGYLTFYFGIAVTILLVVLAVTSF